MNLTEILNETNDSSDMDKAKSLVVIHQHLNESLKEAMEPSVSEVKGIVKRLPSPEELMQT